MKLNLTYLLILSFFFISLSCKEQQQEESSDKADERLAAIELVSQKETQIREDIQAAKQPSVQLALETMEAYRNFIFKYPEDSLSAWYGFRIARLYDGILNDKKQAILEYENLYNNYPEFEERAMLLFFQGSAFHDLNDTTMAIQQLTLFIQRYPEHDFADDAEGLIQLIRLGDPTLEDLQRMQEGS